MSFTLAALALITVAAVTDVTERLEVDLLGGILGEGEMMVRGKECARVRVTLRAGDACRICRLVEAVHEGSVMFIFFLVSWAVVKSLCVPLTECTS